MPTEPVRAGRTDRRPSGAHQLHVPVTRVPIESIRPARSPRVGGEDLEHIERLSQTEQELPPIIVHRATMRVIDGMHRLRAAALRGQHDIEVRFFEGSEEDGFALAVRANIKHGLPLSLADRKAAGERVIASHPHLSDRLIAERTGLAAKTVAAIRQERCRKGQAPAAPPTRVGQDGRARPASTAEGRRAAGQLLADEPGLSLRQVAETTGISPETVRDVRKRLEEHRDPVPDRQQRRRPASRARTGHHPEAARPAQPVPAALFAELPVIVDELEADVTLRATQGGRDLLSVINANTALNNEFGAIAESITETVPAESRASVAAAAARCAEVWRTLATQLRPAQQAGPAEAH